MCKSDPRIELVTIWGFTEEEIEHRWEIHMKFDPLNRLFGSSDSEDDSPTRVVAPKINSDAMLANIESLLS